MLVKDPSGNVSVKTQIVWQVLSCLCAFFACSFVTGLEGLFCALAAAFAAALFCSGAGPLSFLSTAAGSLLGYAFALWSENGGVLYWVSDAPLFDNPVELTVDLRVLGVLWMLCLAGMIAVSVLVIRKGYARTVCVAANTALLVLTQTAGALWILRAKYAALSPELLRDKIALLSDGVADLLLQGLSAAGAQGVDEAALRALASSVVYTVPLVFLVFCGVCAFFHSYLLKRLLQKSGVLSAPTAFMFFPSPASAAAYVGITVAAFFTGLSDSPGAVSYGLELLEGFLSWMFFVPGLSALRLLLDRRKRQGKRSPVLWPVLALVLFPALIGVLFNVIPVVGLVFVISTELKKRLRDQQNLK